MNHLCSPLFADIRRIDGNNEISRAINTAAEADGNLEYIIWYGKGRENLYMYDMIYY